MVVVGLLGNLANSLFSTSDGQVVFGSQFLIEVIMLIIILWFLDIMFHLGNGVK